MDNMRLDNKDENNRETQLQHCEASKRFEILQNIKNNFVDQTPPFVRYQWKKKKIYRDKKKHEAKGTTTFTSYAETTAFFIWNKNIRISTHIADF